MKYFIVTFGCQMNVSDSERIESLLKKMKLKPAKNVKQADLVVVNMCSVRQSAVNRVWGATEKIKKDKVISILTGCILKRDEKNFKRKFDYILNIKELTNWPEIIDLGKKLKEKNYLNIKPNYKSKFTALVPIMTGCNNFCSYCAVPYTRGREVSRPAKEIIEEVKNLAKNGYKEIWLLGQNVNSYKYGFAKLLKKIAEIPGNFKIKFTSSHPKDFSDELIDVMAKYKKIANYLNLPVQSGDNGILKKMNRPYTIEKYKKLVKKIRKKIPDIFLSTDVIVGFPGETKKQFENTKKLFEEIKYDMAYINKYSPRAGTAAFNLKDNVSPKEKKRREKVLEKIIKEKQKKNNKLIVIVGPTASGKTNLSIKIAKSFNGEIVSADSRQVYKGMDIGTGKITKKEMQNIPHHLLDVVSPKTMFTIAQYQKKAKKAIKDIQKRNKLPILIGGTGFYIQAVTDGIAIPPVKPDWKLRKNLEKKSAKELFRKLKKIDPKRAKTIEKQNKRRLIRALEIVMKTKKPIPPFKKNPIDSDILFLGIKKEKEKLAKLIKKRLEKRLKNGMIAEVKRLKKQGISYKRLEKFGLEYKYVALYLQNKITKNEMIEKIQKETEHYAKRQMTWFKKEKRIKWIKNYTETKKLTQKFLK